MPEKARDGIDQDKQRRNGRDLTYPSPFQKKKERTQEYAPAHAGKPGQQTEQCAATESHGRRRLPYFRISMFCTVKKPPCRKQEDDPDQRFIQMIGQSEVPADKAAWD